MRYIRRIKKLYKKVYKKKLKRIGRYIKKHLGDPIFLYPAFIICASLLCVLATQISHGSALRIWMYRMMHDEIIEKGVEEPVGVKAEDYGTFLTKYRFQSFDATNPGMVDQSAPMVALTFDDGPSENATERILKVLEENYSRATFFMVGTNAEKYPELVADIASAGCELGNHTYGHKDLTKLDSAGREEQVDLVNRAVNKATGSDTTVIRPPYGSYDDAVLGDLQIPVVLWDLDTEDWSSRNAQKIVDNVLNQVQDGDIVLMHDIYDSTADAVELLVPILKEKGFQIVTVSEMAKYKGKELECHKAYGKITGES